jgi:hypothetical protein
VTLLIALAIVLGMQQADATPGRVLERGDHGNVDEPRQAVARTPAEWAALWRQHAPDRPQPAVDFAREMVVAVFMGSRSTGGFAVEIVSAREEGGAFVVRYRERRPPPGAMLAQVITSPYHIIAVPQSSATPKFERVQ